MNNEEDPALETVLKMASEKGLGMMLIIMPAKNTALFSKHKFFLFPYPGRFRYTLLRGQWQPLTHSRPDQVSL